MLGEGGHVGGLHVLPHCSSFANLPVLHIPGVDDLAQSLERFDDERRFLDCSDEVVLVGQLGFFLSVFSKEQNLVTETACLLLLHFEVVCEEFEVPHHETL